MRRTIFQMKCEPPTRTRIKSPSSATVDLLDEDVGRLLLGVVVAERLEVVHAGEARRRLLHAIEIERFLHPPHERFRKRAPASRDLIEVAARDGARAARGSDAARVSTAST